ncbi:MAG: OmpA family protein [Sphingomonas sp.]|nr:OmpA family protein [Sphingomonas sp.]
MREIIFTFALLLGAAAAEAQLPGLRRRGPTPPQQQQPVLQGIDAQRAEFAAQSGGTTVYFGAENVGLSIAARTVLSAQANWLRRHPEVVARVEGYGDGGDTRDHALAVGARRAEEARSYLVLLGVPAAQVSATTWGKERPGLGRAVTVLIR